MTMIQRFLRRFFESFHKKQEKKKVQMNDGIDQTQNNYNQRESLDAGIAPQVSDSLQLLNLIKMTAAGGDSSGIDAIFNQQPAEQNNREKERIADRLKNFNPKDNPVWHKITQKFGPNIKQPELLSIAEVLSNSANVKLDRDAKRRKTVLIKWFSENWAAISPYLDFVVLEESTHKS